MAEGKAFLAVNSNRPEISKTVVPDTDRWVIVILLSSYWGFSFVNEEFLMSRQKRWARDPSKSVQTKRIKNFGQSYLLVCIGFFLWSLMVSRSGFFRQCGGGRFR